MNYGSGERWIPGTIVEIRGPLSYIVQISDGLLMCRHQDQIRRRHYDTPENDLQTDILVTGKFTPYFQRRNELSLECGFIMWGSRIIIPPQGQQTMPNELRWNSHKMNHLRIPCQYLTCLNLQVWEFLRNYRRMCLRCLVKASKTHLTLWMIHLGRHQLKLHAVQLNIVELWSIWRTL